MSTYFEDARDFKIDTFVSSSVVYSGSKSPLERLQDNVAVGAMHNSSERSNAPKCYSGTRVAVQEKVISWICSDDDPKILWLKGGPGTGKSAIAGSIADQCCEKGLLAGCFFFSSKSADRRSKRCVVATLVYQLRCHPALQHHIEQHILSSIEHDPFVFAKGLKDQTEELILKPLRKLQPTPFFPKVIIIDGFDECEAEQYEQTTKEDDQLEILRMLLQAASDPDFPFRILISSRSQASYFTEDACKMAFTLSLDARDDTDADIALFLRTRFAEIQRRNKLPVNWADEECIQRLVFYASGRFAWASIMLRNIDRGSTPSDGSLRVRVPREAEQPARLALYMQTRKPGVVVPRGKKPDTTDDGGSWVHSVPPEVASGLTKTERMRQEAINEFIVTEGMYLRDLESLREVWKEAIENQDIVKFQRNDSVAAAFAHFRDIISLTAPFYSALTKRREHHAVVENVGDVLLNHVGQLEPYMSYAERFIWAKDELQKERVANPAFAALAQTIENSPDSRMFPLDAFLWRPLTRFARYRLLLQSVLDYTSTESSDRPHLLKSMDILRDVLAQFHERVASSERRLNLLQLT